MMKSLAGIFELQERQAEQITTAGSSTLEWQLADVRKAVSRTQVRF